MAIVARNLVEAVDFNQLAGTQASNRAFPDAESAQRRLNAIYGVGWGDRGYGQPTPVIPSVVTGSLIEASQWQNLLAVMQTVSNYLGIVVPNTPSASFYAANSLITANNFDWAGAVLALDNARLSPLPANITTKTLVQDTRTDSWSEKPGLTVDVDFGTEDAARWFFNSGGQIVINSSFVPSVASAHNSSWQQLLTDAGTIKIGAFGTSRTGGNSSGTVYSNIGYYSLNDSAQLVFSIQPSAAPFSVNIYSILVQRKSYQGANGSNGSKVTVSVFFDDQYGTPAQAVNGTLTANIGIEKAGAVITIADPATNVLQYLSGSGGTVYFEFSDTINNQTRNYNLLDKATLAAAAANPPVDLSLIPLRATLVIGSSGVLGSDSPAAPALLIPSLLAQSSVRIINNGYIVGSGGRGGAGWSWSPPDTGNGANGGTAIALNYPATIINYGTIGGGGGGGGGSSTTTSTETYDDPGGSGGGGAGFLSGQPGRAGPGESYYGKVGGLTTGGAGGTVSPTGGYSYYYNGNEGGFVEVFNGSPDWNLGFPGGKGGDLGQAGQSGSGNYGAGTGGLPGPAVSGSGNISADSILGTILGPLA